MGAYRYCDECDAGMDRPRLADIRDNRYPCQSCGYDNGLRSNQVAELCDFIEECILPEMRRLNRLKADRNW